MSEQKCLLFGVLALTFFSVMSCSLIAPPESDNPNENGAGSWKLIFSDDFQDGVLDTKYSMTRANMTTEANGYLELRQEVTDAGPYLELMFKDILPSGVTVTEIRAIYDVWRNDSTNLEVAWQGFLGSSNGMQLTTNFGYFLNDNPSQNGIWLRTAQNTSHDINVTSVNRYETWIRDNDLALDLTTGSFSYSNAFGDSKAGTVFSTTFTDENLRFMVSPGGFFTGHILRIDNLRVYYK